MDNLIKGAPLAQATAKDLFIHNHLPLGPDLSQFTSDLIARVRSSQEGQEGMKAFLEKQPPSWQVENSRAKEKN